MIEKEGEIAEKEQAGQAEQASGSSTVTLVDSKTQTFPDRIEMLRFF